MEEHRMFWGRSPVSGNVQEDPNISSEYQIVSVGEKPKNTITVELNKAPAEELTLDNFSFICPTGSPITTDKAQLCQRRQKSLYDCDSGKLWTQR